MAQCSSRGMDPSACSWETLCRCADQVELAGRNALCRSMDPKQLPGLHSGPASPSQLASCDIGRIGRAHQSRHRPLPVLSEAQMHTREPPPLCVVKGGVAPLSPSLERGILARRIGEGRKRTGTAAGRDSGLERERERGGGERRMDKAVRTRRWIRGR